MPKPMSLILLTFLLLGMLVSDSATAQDRSDTGRHKPVPVAVETDKKPETISEAGIGSWIFEINGGLMGGGDLFNARHTSGTSPSSGAPRQPRFQSTPLSALLP